MTRVADETAFLHWLIAGHGPVPTRVGIQLLRIHGHDWRNRYRLTRAKRRAGVVSRRNGFGPGTVFYWTLEDDESPLPETPNTWAACTEVAAHTFWLPASTLPQHCYVYHCPGQLTPDSAPAIQTRVSHRETNTPLDLSQWRSSPSPLRNPKSKTLRRPLRPASRWR